MLEALLLILEPDNDVHWLSLFFGAPKSLQMVIVAMKLEEAYSLEGKLRPT